MIAVLEGYQPQSLGSNAQQASENFVDRLFANREFAEAVYTNRDGFVAAHLKDDWKQKGSSPQTDRFLSRVANENAKLTADVLFSAFQLSQ